jgi:hypothetical protein
MKIVGVQDGDTVIPTQSIMLDQLWKMGSHFKLQGSRHKSVERKLAIGTVDTNERLIQINIKRCLNVLFSKKTKPLLTERGATLSKQQLQDKLRTDQEFHQTLIIEYNDDNNPVYSAHTHPSACAFCNTADFIEIPSEPWKNF